MSDHGKRKAEDDLNAKQEKRIQTKKPWQSSRKKQFSNTATIQPGDSGIWATCIKGREGKATAELRDLFTDYAEFLHPDSLPSEEGTVEGENIEHDIETELAKMKAPQRTRKQLFVSVRLDVQCLIFFKTMAPIEPVSFVQKICEDAFVGQLRVKTRFAQRLTPMTMIGHASTDGLEKVAKQVLAPYFHEQPQITRKFAIRTNMRNHKTSPRDSVIKQVASVVGPGHTVDLHHYDVLILVEYFQNVCGMSVVSSTYERLKRYNLAELMQIDQDPPPPPPDDDAR